jgi:hypothetical protein
LDPSAALLVKTAEPFSFIHLVCLLSNKAQAKQQQHTTDTHTHSPRLWLAIKVASLPARKFPYPAVQNSVSSRYVEVSMPKKKNTPCNAVPDPVPMKKE